MTISATKFRSNCFNILDNAIISSEPVTVTTKRGNAVILNEQDYNSIMETLYLCSIPGLKESILESKKSSLSELAEYKEGEEW